MPMLPVGEVGEGGRAEQADAGDACQQDRRVAHLKWALREAEAGAEAPEGGHRLRQEQAVVARAVNGERVVLLGWPCAILMQLAHPLIAAGVQDHSSFRVDALAPVRRLHATVQAMLGLTFGNASEQDEVLQRIRGIHTRVHGRLRQTVGPWPAGTPYSAEDPDLLLWVHATMLHTTMQVFERTVRPLTAAERDAYCRESAPIAIGLGAASERVPQTHDRLAAVVEQHLSITLAVGPDARAVADALLHSLTVRMTGPGGPLLRSLTALWLPPSLRDGYGVPWTATDASRARRVEGMMRRVRHITPGLLARWRG